MISGPYRMSGEIVMQGYAIEPQYLTYSNILQILPPQTEIFQINFSYIFIPQPIGSGDIAISMASIRPSFHSSTHPCVLHNFDTLRHILVIFGRNEEEDQ